MNNRVLEKKVRTSYNLTPAIMLELEKYANKEGLTKSAIVHLALKEYLKKHSK